LNILDGKVEVKGVGQRAELQRRLSNNEPLQDSTYWLKEYGLADLEGRHILVEKGSVGLQFSGANGVWFDRLICDIGLASMLADRKVRTGDTAKVFPRTKYDLVSAYIEKAIGGGHTIQDLRNARGTQVAIEEVNRLSSPVSWEEYIANVHKVADVVSRLLGGTARHALLNYISPVVFAGWRVLLATNETDHEEFTGSGGSDMRDSTEGDDDSAT
jgi:DNA topoisomerase IB